MKKGIDPPKAIFYFPMWDIVNYTKILKYKDPGEIPLYLGNLGYQITFVTGMGKIDEDPIRKSIESGNVNRFSFLDNLKEIIFVILLSKEINESNLVLILSSPPSAIVAAMIVKLTSLLDHASEKRKVVLRMDTDGDIFKTMSKSVYYVFLLSIGAFFFDSIAVETTCAQKRLSKFCLRKEKIIMVPEGYSKRMYNIRPHNSLGRKNVILFVGRITWIKGIDVLVKAFHLIHTSYPNWSLRIAGPIEDEVYYKELELLTRELSLGSKVDFLGKLSYDELREEYHTASIFAFPSRSESFGIARIEAIVNGLPVITTEAGCGKDLKGAVIIPYDDPPSLAKALEYLISYPKTRSDLVEEGQRNILSWEEATMGMIYGKQKDS